MPIKTKQSPSIKTKDETIGAIDFEDLDFLVDPTMQRLFPRDPKIVASEIE